MTSTKSSRRSPPALLDLIRAVQVRYRDDPVGFCDRVLRSPPLWSRQAEICRSVVDHRVTVVYSGNAVGKDFVLGRLAPWFGFTRPNSLVVITGVSQTLLGTVTFKEMRRAVGGSPLFRALGIKVSGGLKSSPLSLVFAPGWHILGFSTDGIERASGQHAGEMLAVINEASGVDDDIYDAVDSWGYSRLLVAGNPLRPDGRFVDLIRQAERDKADGLPPAMAVNAIRIPSTESPDAHLERSLRGLADRTWIESNIRRHGVDSGWVRAHINAEIPSIADDVLLPGPWLDWCVTAHSRRAIMPAGHPVYQTRRIACDLAEGVGRDSSCILVRDDWGIVDVTFGSTLGLPEAAEIIRRKSIDFGVPFDRITYDMAGIGKDFHLYLTRNGLKGTQGYAGAGRPRSGEFRNLRSEAAWRLRRRLDPDWQPGGIGSNKVPFAIPNGPYWPRMRDELAALTYSIAGRQTSLIDKDDHCTKLGHSPDLADALIQSFAFD